MSTASPLAAALAAALALQQPPPVARVALDPVPPASAPGHVPRALSLEPAPDAPAPDPEPDPAGLRPWAPSADPSAFPPEPAPAPAPAPDPDPPPSVAPPPPPPPRGVGCHGSRPCRRLLALGGVAAGLGVAGVATGAALVARRDLVAPDDPTSLVTYRPAGAAFLAVGAGLLTTWLLTLLAAVRAGKLAQRRQARDARP